MEELPVHRRPYHAFLSHSSADKDPVVDAIFTWFDKTAAIPLWYDRYAMPAGSRFSSFLAESIVKCRSMVIVVSQSSISSGWAEEEWGLALDHQNKFPRFKIIPVVIDDCDPPGFLASRTHYRLTDRRLDFTFFDAMLRAMYGDGAESARDLSRDIYVSRTWRSSEARTADIISRRYIDAGFRLIGDAEDRPDFSDSTERVRNIIASTGGLLSILPYRPKELSAGCTSKYILEELRMAKAIGRPYVIFAEPGVSVPDDLVADAVDVVTGLDPAKIIPAAVAASAIDGMLEQWQKDHPKDYVFFATNFDRQDRNSALRQMISRVTTMPCVLGEEVQVSSRSVQQEITEQVSNATVLLGDISGSNVNTLIEIGIARGAGVPFYLLDEEPRQRPAFMLRDAQVFYYRDDVELLGYVHRLMYPYRRRTLNAEL